jgi:hypothetical protein
MGKSPMHDSPPLVERPKALNSRAWAWAIALLATALFSMPLLFLFAARGYYLPFSAESLVYRYFASLRILEGEGRTVFLPQGQLITLLQDAIVAGLQRVPGIGLERSLELFSTCTSMAVSLAMFGVCLATCLDKRLTLSDKALVLVSGPAIVLGTVHAGFYYTLLPDYYALDFPIITASIYLALRCIRSAQICRMSHVVAIGSLAGLAATNKLTLLGPMGMVALLVIMRPPLSCWGFLGRTAIAGLVCAATYLVVFSAAYLFRFGDTIQALRYAMRFIGNAGAEPNFWESNFRFFLRGYGYGNILVVWVAATIFCGTEVVRLKRWRSALLLLANLLVAGLLTVGLLKRGAGTTFFEASSILAGMAALILAAGLGLRRYRSWMLILPAAILLGAASRFDYRHNWFVVVKGGELGRTVWAARNYALHFRRPIVAVIPDRSYFTGSVEEFLETSFFLSGYGPASATLQERFLAQTTFRTEPGEIRLGTTIVWLEKWDPVGNCPLKQSDRAEAKRWATMTKLAAINPGQSWRAGYGDLGIINVISVVRLN